MVVSGLLKVCPFHVHFLIFICNSIKSWFICHFILPFDLVIFISVSGKTLCCRISKVLFYQCYQKPFSKSTKQTYGDEFHSIDCSIIILRMVIWSGYDLFCLNPAYSLQRHVSKADFILSRGIFFRILLGA